MDNKDKYDLYTEHVFPDKVKKKRKIIRRVVSVTGLAVLFGIVSSGIMLLTYNVFADFWIVIPLLFLLSKYPKNRFSILSTKYPKK